MRRYNKINKILSLLIISLLFVSTISTIASAGIFRRSQHGWFSHTFSKQSESQQSKRILNNLFQKVKTHKKESTNPTIISKIRLSPYSRNKISKISNYLGQIKSSLSKPHQNTRKSGVLKSSIKFQTSNGVRCATGGSECVVPPKRPTQGSICDRLKQITQNCITSKDTCRITCRATCGSTCSGISCNIGCSNWKPTEGKICQKVTSNCPKPTNGGLCQRITSNCNKPTEGRVCQITSNCKLTFDLRCDKPTTAGSGGICEITSRDNGGFCNPDKWPTDDSGKICEYKPTEGRVCQITSNCRLTFDLRCDKPTYADQGGICQITSKSNGGICDPDKWPTSHNGKVCDFKPTQGSICKITSKCINITSNVICQITTKETCGLKCPTPTSLLDPECMPTKDSNKLLCTIGGPNCPDKPTIRGTCGILPTFCQDTCQAGPTCDTTCQQTCAQTCMQTCCGTCSATSCGGDCPTYTPTSCPASCVTYDSSPQCTGVYDNNNPVADFMYSPQHPKMGEIVQFDSTSSYDPDEMYGDYIVSWLWDFDGDGNWDSEEQNPTYQCDTPGEYIVTLMVIDTHGAYGFASKTITVETNNIYVYSWKTVYENTTFPVIVADYTTEDGIYSPVEGAMVEFNGETNLTNESGITTFVAPEVKENTTFQIIAQKDTLSNSTSILVINNPNDDPTDKQLIILTYPSSPILENTTFLVTVHDGYNYVENALVEFNNITSLTNETGVTKLTAPSVENDTEFNITVSKEGYISNITSILVKNRRLYVYTYNETGIFSHSILENSIFYVRVGDETDWLENVTITFLDETYSTDEEGIAALTAPEVEENTTFEITAHKPGYTNVSTTIVVNNIKDAVSPLYVICENSVVENTTFYVIVASYIDENGYIPVEGAKVKFNNETKITNETGITTFVAPEVEKNKTFLATVEKEGYLKKVFPITVINNPDNIPPQPDLKEFQFTIFPKEIYSGDTFYIYITDRTGKPATNVLVEFYNNTFYKYSYTDEKGYTVCIAPRVDEEKSFEIRFSKEGWETKIFSVTILPIFNIPPIVEPPCDPEKFYIASLNETGNITEIIPENSMFYIIAFKNNSDELEAIPRVFVSFDNQSGFTDNYGLIQFTAPPVDNTTRFIINATKDGYNTSIYVLVKDISENNASQEDALTEKVIIPLLPLTIAGIGITLLSLMILFRKLKTRKRKQPKHTYYSRFQPVDRSTVDDLYKEELPYFEPIPEETAGREVYSMDNHIDTVIDRIIEKKRKERATS